MQKNLKKSISILLSILMIVGVFTIVPITASAATTVDLSTLDTDYEAQDGDTLTGTLAGQYKITVADGATVTLKDATITCLSSSTTYDGIALLGDATILLEGENTVKGGHKYNAGIFVPEEKTLTIDGTGSLNVFSGGSVSAIGAKRSGSVTGIPGGNIVINGGTINATGGNGGAGIGGCTVTNCGTITINGGNITAVGNDSAPGIGSGNRASFCAGITISGGTVTATGNGRAAGIGCGYSGSCGNITIADTVTKVTAIKGDSSPNSIGPGSGGYSCGTITIGGEVTGDIAESPYVYPTYTVTWKNGDSVIETDTGVAAGTTPTYDGTTPTKAADGDHMYVFSGWTPELAPVTEDVTYTATFTSSADLVEITDHETAMGDLGLDYVMVEWGRSMTAQEAITLAQYMSAQNDGANCAVLYEAVDDYDLQYAMSDGTTGSRTGFIGYALNDFLPDYKVYYLPVNLNPETIELNLNPDNATVIWYDATDSDGYWSMEAAYNDSCYLVLKGNSNQPAGTYEWADMGSGCGIRDYDASQEIYFVDGSCTVTVDEDVVTVSGTFTGRDRNTYVVTVTYEAPYYTITDESVNGAVTAGVNGADVTNAKAGKTVLLNVAPDEGYQFKSITASAQKTNPEDFSDLVALMGDAVFDGDENYDCGGYTCKVEDGKFVVYNGANLLAELSESNMTGFNGDGDSDYYVDVNSDDAVWSFFVENGEITGIDVMDADYDYVFSAVSGSKSTGTLQPVQVDLTTVAEGSQYSFTMPNKPVTVTAEFEQASAPELPEVIKDCTYHAPDGQKIFANVPVFDIPDEANKLLSGYIFADIDTSDDEGGMRSIVVEDTKNYSYKLYDKNGNEINATITYSDSYIGTELKDDSNATKEWFVDFADDDVLYDKGYDLGGSYDTVYIVANAPAPKLFTGHTVTLGGDIGVNFYLNPEALEAYAGTKTVKFTVDGKEITVDVPATATADGYKVTCNVVAAQMAHKITATLYVDGEAVATDEYSVQEYAEAVYAKPGDYTTEDKADALKALAAAMLHYGGEAQTVFDSALHSHPDRADSNLDEAANYSGVTADAVAAAISGTASNLNAVATQLGAKFYTSSLLYLSQNTLRLYFTRNDDSFDPALFDGVRSDYYYYVQKADIPAAELDDQQSFTLGNGTINFSALDYVKAVLNSDMTPAQKNLAKSLFLYNQAANAYFDEAPAPVQKILVLDDVTEDTTVEDGYTITGTLKGDYKISIADGATVTLKDVNITNLGKNCDWAGINCPGNATLVLEGENTVCAGRDGYDINNYPGIWIAPDKTLTIEGDGSLTAYSNNTEPYGAGIGGGYQMAAGNIVINGGTITANGGDWAAGIGSGYQSSCGNITITGGTVTANGGSTAAGIGSGLESTCGNILITGGTVTANGGSTAPGIGSGQSATCGNITIADTVTQVTATKGNGSPNSIGAGYSASCGTVTIAPGANVTQN